jgi:hypothetical protein
MAEPFEEAWSLLKAAFQPAQGGYIGSGMNQTVYGQEGNPDVVKVGDMDANPNALSDMYWLHNLAQMSPQRFAGQRPIEQTAELPQEVRSHLPMLSVQERGVPFEEHSKSRVDAIRGRQLADAIFSMGDQGKLLEGMGMADIKPPNWMKVAPDRPATHNEEFVTGKPGPHQAVIHDPMFYGPTNTGGDAAHEMAATIARGVPRRLGPDYTIPEETKERFARTLDANPFDKFTMPIDESLYGMDSPHLDAGIERLNQQQRAVDDMRASLGI